MTNSKKPSVQKNEPPAPPITVNLGDVQTLRLQAILELAGAMKQLARAVDQPGIHINNCTFHGIPGSAIHIKSGKKSE